MNNIKIKGTLIIMWLLYLAACCVSFSGCVTPEKAMRKLDESKQGAKYCADRFPVQERVDTLILEVPYEDTQRVKDLQDYADQLEKRIDYLGSLPPVLTEKQCAELKAQYKADVQFYSKRVRGLLDSLKTAKTQVKKVVVTQKDIAELDTLKARHATELAMRDRAVDMYKQVTEKAEKEAAKWKGKAQDRQTIIWWLILALGGALGWIFRGPLLGGVGGILSKLFGR